MPQEALPVCRPPPPWWHGLKKPCEDGQRDNGAGELGHDEAGKVDGPDAGERVGERAGNRHGWIGERGRGCEPVGSRDVEADQPRDRLGTKPQSPKDDADQAEGGHHLRPPLCSASAALSGPADQRQIEHQVCSEGPRNPAGNLCPNVSNGLGGGKSTSEREDEGYGRIEMGT